ncbi:Putative metalloproteinase inhibitor [Toxocara canis]|uniref:Putative metalloproteinase inhibitor n=1 Tax=Toxocara canis TaxID=6265 RepID=A0A0B2VFA6_TOXCA|nr:Putative metalloproteinase inhibitor [Toxocara canis]
MRLLAELLAFSLIILATEACRCLPLSANEAFKNAEWVSRVKILGKKKELNSERESTVYKVKHIEVFKNTRSPQKLPAMISTPTSSAACGLFLKTGKQYLLSGGFTDQGNLTAIMCGQIALNDENSQSFGIVLQWNEVPEDLKEKLRKGTL